MWNKQPRKTEKINTLIGADTSLEGNLHFNGGLHVDGRINGNVIAIDDEPDASISISEQGVINGEIRSPFVNLNGVVHGNVHSSEHIQIASKARIEGDVHYKLLEMAVGAEVNGKLIRMDTADKNVAGKSIGQNADKRIDAEEQSS